MNNSDAVSSVVSAGPDGYKYQHTTSLLFILQYLSKYEVISATIDAPGTEDCQIKYMEKDTEQICVAEIQCKDYQTDLTELAFSRIITHFEERSAIVNVLTKLADELIDRFHLIYKGNASSFAAKLNVLVSFHSFDKKKDKPVTGKSLRSLTNAISKGSTSPGSDLIKERDDFNLQLAGRLISDKTLFQGILQKIYVSDRLPQDEAAYQVKSVLGKNFRIPAANAEACTTDLLAVIWDKKGTGTNIISSLRSIILKHQAGVQQLEGYISRGIEEELLQILQRDRILLLTGNSLCGKTWFAKAIAARLIASSAISYKETFEPNEANQFMTEVSVEEKLCLLEDPFGPYPEVVSPTLYQHFSNLLANLPRNQPRYLIVTSRKETAEYIPETKCLPWKFLNVTNRPFLKKIWKQLASRLDLDPKLDVTVTNLLETEPIYELLQPGELGKLVQHIESLKNTDPESVKHLARLNAAGIARLLAKKGSNYVDLFMVFGLTATTLDGPTMEDLTYVLGDEVGYLPGIFKTDFIIYGGGSARKKGANSLPKYKSLPPLPPAIKLLLTEMEDKEYLEKKGDNYVFSHPIYQESGRYLFDRKAYFSFQKIMEYATKCLASLNPTVAISTIKSLYVLFGYHSSDSVRVQDIISVVLEAASHSIFLSVQGVAQLFVLNKYEYLTAGQKKALYDRLARGVVRTIYWDGDIAFYPPESSRDALVDMEAKFMTPEAFQELYEPAIRGERVGTRNAWLILEYLEEQTHYRKERVNYDTMLLSRFLYYNETFIRELAAYLLAASCTADTLPHLSLLVQTEDPFTVFQLVKGVIRAYPYLESEAGKGQMLHLILQAYDRLMVVCRSVPLMTQFSSGHAWSAYNWDKDIDDTAVPRMWYVWGEMMPLFFKHLGPQTYVYGARFSAALMDSSKFLLPKQQLNLLQSWIDWCKRQEHPERETQFVEILYQHFLSLFDKFYSAERLALYQQLLQLDHPILVSQLVNVLVYKYNQLAVEELEYLQSFLLQTKEEYQNAALVTEGVSPVIQNALTGCPNLKELSTPELVEVVSIQRLRDCLMLLFPVEHYCDLDYTESLEWKRHLLFFLATPGHPLFLLAIRRIIFENQHYPGSLAKLYPLRHSILLNIFGKPDRRRNEMFFTLLLNELIFPKSSVKVLLSLFFSSIDESDKSYFGERLTDYIEAITYSESVAQIPRSIFRRFIAPHLKKEKLVLRFCRRLKQVTVKGKMLTTAQKSSLEMMLKDVHFRNYSAINYLYKFTDGYSAKFPSDIAVRIKVVREAVYKRHEEQRTEVVGLIKELYELNSGREASSK